MDETSGKIVDNVVTEDEVLNSNIASQSSTMLPTTQLPRLDPKS